MLEITPEILSKILFDEDFTQRDSDGYYDFEQQIPSSVRLIEKLKELGYYIIKTDVSC